MDYLKGLNEPQYEAVTTLHGPLMVLAGAGSGKTRVLTMRIAHLITNGIDPFNILALTFTNKAAKEMKLRIAKVVGEGNAKSLWMGTFHSVFARILRSEAHYLGFPSNFTIYDTQDSLNVLKKVLKDLNIDQELYKPKKVQARISSYKNNLITVRAYQNNPELIEADERSNMKYIGKIYEKYVEQCFRNGAMDFDDLLLRTNELLTRFPEVLAKYQDRFRYILVDEYQDTNHSQYLIVKALSSKFENICVVGDDAQSIYSFRGANIYNILNFKKDYPDAKTVSLEQNYRSTQNILNAANEVIANNQGRKAKRLWTENPEGDLIDLRQFQSGFEEAEYVAGEITRGVRTEGKKYRDYAILYRTNAQSRLFEEKLLLANVPYKIVGGVNFYARREIKDLLAYLRVIENPEDDLAVLRIINVPRRGIGAATINKVQDWEAEQGIRFYDALLEAEYVPGLMRSLNKIKSFTSFLQVLRAKADYLSVKELLNEIIEETGYVADLQAEGTEEAAARIENIDELISKIADYEESAEQPSLGGFLQEVALVSDIDSVDEESDYVLLMTLHSAKGLEFPNVFLAGMEDGIFPSYMTITGDDPSELEEERRLCYVGITRAMQHLTLTCARQRMIRGEVQYNKMSRFVKEIPRELISLERERGEIEDRKPKMDIPTRGSVYAAMKQAFREKPQQAKTFSAQKATKLDYEIGDTVRHIKFGVGIVTDIVDGGRDYEVTVNFDQAGTKKMFASFAKLKKL